MWIAVVLVVWLGRDPRSFALALASTAIGLIGLRAVLIPGYQVVHAIGAVVALGLWSVVGWGLRLGLPRAAAALGSRFRLRIGLLRLAVVLSVVWLGFVAWSWVRWEIVDQTRVTQCLMERRSDPAGGSAFQRYHPSPDPRFEMYLAETYPLQHFATRHRELALLPALLLAVFASVWIAHGFKLQPLR
ncbi:hypothetical protein [Reyranella sp.]|uniref:hypothetical protein n=1 Tax=Reyranella sp. TaxID=1929291 RepID=UPI003D12785D